MPLENAFKQNFEETGGGRSSDVLCKRKQKQKDVDVNKLEAVQWFYFTGCPKKYTD